MAVKSVLTRIQFYWLVIASVHATAEKVNNCQITPSTDPEYANISCIFADNVGRLNKAFALYQDFGNTTKEKVTCNVFGGKPICEASDGFQEPKTVTERADFLVPKTSNASFICDTIPPVEGVRNRGCILDDGTPQPTQPPIPNEGSGNTGWRDLHTGLVVGVPLTVAVLIVAAVFMIRRQRSRGRANEPHDGEIGETESLRQDLQLQENTGEAATADNGVVASDGVDGLLPWCKCGNCREMPTQRENECCKEEPCLSSHEDFTSHVLNKARNWVPKDWPSDKTENQLKEAKRAHAYKLYVSWKHANLGPGVKMVIPSCCVWSIRRMLPDSRGEYTGFVQGDYYCVKESN